MIRAFALLLCLCLLTVGCKKKTQPASDDAPAAKSAGVASDTSKPVLPSHPTRPALPVGWVEFKHPDGAYSVYLPNRPRPIKVSAGSDLKQQVPMGRMLMSDYATDKTAKLYCEVGVAVYSPELVESVKAAKAQRGPVIGANAKRSSVTWCGQTAFEDTNEDPESHLLTIQRSMWIGNRAYYCSLYDLEQGRPTTEERVAVFDSFAPSN